MSSSDDLELESDEEIIGTERVQLDEGVHSSSWADAPYSASEEDFVLEKYASIGHGLKAIAKALDRTNNLASKKVEIMKNIYEELEKMGVPDDKILDAYIFLGTNKNLGKLFLAAPVHVRPRLLEKMMNRK